MVLWMVRASKSCPGGSTALTEDLALLVTVGFPGFSLSRSVLDGLIPRIADAQDPRRALSPRRLQERSKVLVGFGTPVVERQRQGRAVAHRRVVVIEASGELDVAAMNREDLLDGAISGPSSTSSPHSTWAFDDSGLDNRRRYDARDPPEFSSTFAPPPLRLQARASGHVENRQPSAVLLCRHS